MSSHLSQREAALQWFLGRATIQRAIKTGKLSLTMDKRIDAAEMLRVFGEPRPALNATSTPPKTIDPMDVYQHNLALMEAQKELLQAENAMLRDQLRETVAAKDANLADLRAEVLRLAHDRPRRQWWRWGKG